MKSPPHPDPHLLCRRRRAPSPMAPLHLNSLAQTPIPSLRPLAASFSSVASGVRTADPVLGRLGDAAATGRSNGLRQRRQGRGTLTSFEDTQIFEFVFKMTRKTFSYICSLVMRPSMEDMNSYTFTDGRVLSLQDRVVVALRRLQCSEPTETLGSSVGVNESTIMLVTERFVAAVCGRAKRHGYWPESSATDEIKSMFGKIHNMPNCCGVLCTTHVPFRSNCDHEKKQSTQMQVVVDPRMRFMDAWFGLAGSMNQASLLQDSEIFKGAEKGDWLNGSKLKVAVDGSEVGEYIIGDEGYPLLPWLLTPYQEEDLPDSKAEFNRRHSATTTCALKAMARFKGTWKYLQEETSWPVNPDTVSKITRACCMLHNIVIDMEDDAAMPRPEAEHWNYCEEVRKVENEDAVRARDMLSQYFLTTMSSKSGVGPVDVEEDDEVAATGSGDENKEQEAETKAGEEERQCQVKREAGLEPAVLEL